MDVTRFLGTHRYTWLTELSRGEGSSWHLMRRELAHRGFPAPAEAGPGRSPLPARFMNINLFALVLTAAVILDPYFVW